MSSVEEAIKEIENYLAYEGSVSIQAIATLYTSYDKEKEKNRELEKQNKILEVEKVRYNIQYLESNISQTPDTTMVYYSMKKHLETLKEEKIKLETELQELLNENHIPHID